MKIIIFLFVLLVAGYLVNLAATEVEMASAVGSERAFAFKRQSKIAATLIMTGVVIMIGLLSQVIPIGITVAIIVLTLALSWATLNLFSGVPELLKPVTFLIIMLFLASLYGEKLRANNRWGMIYFFIELVILAVTWLRLYRKTIKAVWEKTIEYCTEESDESEDLADDDSASDSEDDDGFQSNWLEIASDVITSIDWAAIFIAVLKIVFVAALVAGICWCFWMLEVKFNFLPPY